MSHAIDFMISITMVFLAFSIMVSSATEVWNAAHGKRAQFLWVGVARMIGGTPDGDLIVRELRAHPTIRALSRSDDPKSAASYIPSSVFAAALVDVILVRNATTRLDKYGLPEAIALLPHSLPLKRSLMLALGTAKGDEARFCEEVARFYDNCMDRVNGWYKRDAEKRAFWAALLMAVVLNIDAVHIASALWKDQNLARQTADQGNALSKQVVVNVHPAAAGQNVGVAPVVVAPAGSAATSGSMPANLPVGWPPQWYSEIQEGASCTVWAWHVAAMVLGLFLMAAAAVIGAPFWYQALNTLLPLRAAGKVPPRTALPHGAQASDIRQPSGNTGVVISDTPVPGDWLNELERAVVEQRAVAEVQLRLGVPESGSLDVSTREGIRAMQEAKGYAPTGQLTQLLLRDLDFKDRFGR